MTFCALRHAPKKTLWRFSGRAEIIYGNVAIEKLYRCPVALLPREKGTFHKESAETSINSYCHSQAALKKNIKCPNECLVSDYWSEVWLSIAPLERDYGWPVIGFDHCWDLTVSAYKVVVRSGEFIFLRKQVKENLDKLDSNGYI